MRLRLVHKLSLLMLSFALLAVLALGGLTAWNLRHGFGEYLAAREVVQLEAFVDYLESQLNRNVQPAVQVQDLSMHALLNGFRGLPKDAPAPHRGPPPGHEPPDAGGGWRPPSPAPQAAWPERLSVRGLGGQLLLGRQVRASAAGHVDRPVHQGDRQVAWVRLERSDAIDAGGSHFLYQQYGVIAGASLGLVLLALLGAAWLARRWVKPLEAVAKTSRQLAMGDFSVRLDASVVHKVNTDEIGDVVLHINRMAESLQTLEKSRRRWLADISHELRTPLTVMQGDIEALCDGVRPLTSDAVQVLRNDVRHLGKLVNDLHLLAVADLQALPCDFQWLDPSDMLRQLVSRYAARAHQQGLDLQLVLTHDLGQVCWDVARIEQLCVNLLENSIRYTQSPGHVVLSVRLVQERVHLEIDDTAPGVAEQDLARLWEPLFRSDAARSRALGGSGLGLAIAQAIAQAHAGHMQARASRLGGLCVHVDLPTDPQAHVRRIQAPA